MPDDDFSRDYLEHRAVAERENGPLADFLRQNAGHFTKPEIPEPVAPDTGESPETAPIEGKPSTLKKVIDYTGFMVRPLGALQEAAIAPLAHDYESETHLGRAGEAFAVSGKAFGSALFPKGPGERPDYEAKIIEDEFPNIPDSLRPAAEVFLGVATDPAMLAFPFMKSVRAGLNVRAMEKTESGPWRRAVEEAVAIGPTRDEDAARLAKLAGKADAGDTKAAQELVEEVVGEQRAQEQISTALGSVDKPIVSIVDPKDAAEFAKGAKPKIFLDTPRPKHALNINLSRVNTSEDVQSLLDDTAKFFKGDINEARRGVQTNKATEALATSMNMLPEELLARRKGQAFNAESALAARQILVSSAESLKQMAVKVLDPNVGDLDRVAFRKQLSLHKAIQEQVSGLTTEAGRALQQFNVGAKSTKLQLAQIKDLTARMGEAGDFTDDMARAISDMKNPEQIAAFAKDINRATTKDLFFEVWINSLLSGPQTQAVNTLSNSLVAFWQIPERAVAAGVSKILNTGPESVHITEAVGQAYGMVEGVKDGMKAFARTLITEDTADIVSKIERPMNAAISADALGLSGGVGRAVDYLGRGVRLPGTLLSSTDAFFKSIGYRMELHARAFRQAAEEGLSGPEAAKRIQDVMMNPPPDIHLAAIDAARYQTFTQPLGETGRAYQHMVASTPVLKVITPFVRTPTNIFKFFGERSPFAPISKAFRADIKAGGTKRDLALARVSLGSSVMAVAAVQASEGKITGGGPVDPGLKALKYDTGWQPYSIKIGDKYVSYGRMEPLGTLFGVAADFSEIAGELDDAEAQEVVAHLAMATAKNVTSKTFLRGLSEAINAIDDPVRYGERWWGNLASSVIPTGVAQVARVGIPGMVEGDPILRETRTVLDKIKSRIPGYSQELPPRRNIWGDPIELSGGLGPDIISPFYSSEKVDDPVSEELIRLEASVSKQEKTIAGVELTAEQYDRLTVLTGKEPIDTGEPNLKEALLEQMNDPEYTNLTDGVDGGKAFVLQRIVYVYKKAAREKLLQEDPELREQVNRSRGRQLYSDDTGGGR